MNHANIHIASSTFDQNLIVTRLLLYNQKNRMQGKRWLCLDASFSPIATLTGKANHEGVFSFNFSIVHRDVSTLSTPVARIKGRMSGTTRNGRIFLINDKLQNSRHCASIETGASGINIYNARTELIGKVKSCFFPTEYKIYSGSKNPCYNLRKDKHFFKLHNDLCLETVFSFRCYLSPVTVRINKKGNTRIKQNQQKTCSDLEED